MKTRYKDWMAAVLLVGVVLLASSSCDDFVRIDPPRTVLVKTTVFESDETAEAAIVEIYNQLKSGSFASGSVFSVSYLGSILSDEEINYFQSTAILTAEVQQFNDNALEASNSVIQELWADLYRTVYKTNAALEGLANSKGLTDSKRDQLMGEAKFIRAFCYFYLVNLWGDVPLALTTDYQSNSVITRMGRAEVFQQITQDLLDAKTLLPLDYSVFGQERVRANSWAAAAMLARVYLYQEDWANAAIMASAIIDDAGHYGLSPALGEVFHTNSHESILQWWSLIRPTDRSTFRFSDDPQVGAVNPGLIGEFETNDQRLATWTSLRETGYYTTLKYDFPDNNPPVQYSTVLRLGEQFLIRAESRAHQGDIPGALADLNTIRNRSSLGDTPANDQASVLLAIEKERLLELFNEWGHRWFDIRRTGRVNAILGPIKPDWSPTDELLPIPELEMVNNVGLQGSQNPGY